MNQAMKTFTPERAEARKWIGRIMMAVILGEAIWNLIVSVMNNLVVPWLGDVMGPSSGVPTSFTQRPYDYPDLFISVLELCIAGIVAVIVNYFFQRQMTTRVKSVKTSVPTASVESALAAPHGAPAAAALTEPIAHATPPEPVVKSGPDTPPASVAVAPATPPPSEAIPTGRPVATQASPVANSPTAKPVPPASKAEPPELKKLKEVYYNIVGEPIASDED